MKKVIPLGDRVLVKRLEKKAQKGAILLPDSAQETPREGTVIAIGPGKRDDAGNISKMELSLGDTVLFGPYAGSNVIDLEEDGECLIMKEEDILAVIS